MVRAPDVAWVCANPSWMKKATPSSRNGSGELVRDSVGEVLMKALTGDSVEVADAAVVVAEVEDLVEAAKAEINRITPLSTSH